MKRKIRITFIAIAVFMTVYIILSWFLLDGQLTYGSSVSNSSIEESKEANLFVTDDLEVICEGDTLKNWSSYFNIWTNKRSETKYFGIMFHWTFEDPSWRYLHIEPKEYWIRHSWFRRKLTVNDRTWEYKNGFSGGYESCCGWVACLVGDTVTIQLHRGKNHDDIIGNIKVLIK